MNEETNQKMLDELRKIRLLIQVSLYLTILIIVVPCAFIMLLRHRAMESRSARALQEPYQTAQQASAGGTDGADAWTQIQGRIERGDWSAALSLAKGLTNRTPADYSAYVYLAQVFFAMGDLTNAEAQYVRAFDLYPIEANGKALAAIRQRLALEQGAHPK